MESSATKFLIVNADDFGLSHDTNRGIIDSHERGIVSSVSLMVRHSAAAEAAEYARAHPPLSVGLHVDLGEWARDGADAEKWSAVYEVVNVRRRRYVRRESRAQLQRFRALM